VLLVPGLDGLIQDLAVSFGLPLVGFILFSIVGNLTHRSRVHNLLRRISIAFILLAFVYLISNLMYQDRAVLVELWRSNPAAFSFVYTAGAILVVAGLVIVAYTQLRPGLWRQEYRESDR
jgi:hypothetical protein